jgi:hypothetical protein
MSRAKTSSKPTSGMLERMSVVAIEGGWQVRGETSSSADGVYSTQTEATEAARQALRRSGGQTVVHGADGRIRESITLGRDAMAKIAAVEGIHLSPAMTRMLEALDRQGASSAERRLAIAQQFGKKA